jgi:hypothetical protein
MIHLFIGSADRLFFSGAEWHTSPGAIGAFRIRCSKKPRIPDAHCLPFPLRACNDERA